LALQPASPLAAPLARRRGRTGSRPPLAGGIAVLYLSIIVMLPLAAVVAKSFEGGAGEFIDQVTQPQAVAALELTLLISLGVTAVNVVMGTLLAWVLVRDDFRGRSTVNMLIDLPFALPTIVAGLTLLALYGARSPVGIDIAYTRIGVAMALLFVTLPFVVRAVQPTLQEVDREMEEAAASLGARPLTIFWRVVLPNLRPAIVAGASLAFARALGEFGSVVLISGNLPYKTEVASVFIFSQIENDNVHGAAAVSVVLLIASLVLLAAVSRIARPGRR
jgi:sulfate transport system permease protein